MKLCMRSFTLTCGVIWGGMFLVVALLNQFGGSYGGHLLDFASSIYPGYGGPAGYGSVLVVTLYGFVDGAVGGAIFAWLYNRFLKG